MNKSYRPTVADLIALKGRRQLSMLRVVTLDEAAAAEAAGLEYGDFITAEDYLRAAVLNGRRPLQKSKGLRAPLRIAC